MDNRKSVTEDCFLKLKSNTNWKCWRFESRELYERRFATAVEEHSYENSFAYYQQECRHNAVIYVSDEILATVYSRSEKSNFAIFLPSICDDKTAISILPSLCQQVKDATGRRVIVRKCQPALFDALKVSAGFRVMNPEEYDNPRELPEDILPQVVVNISTTASLLGHDFMKIRNHIQYARKQYKIEGVDLTRDNCGILTKVILTWAKEYDKRAKMRQTDALEIVNDDGVDPQSYTVFNENFADLIDNQAYFGRVILADGHPVAFSFAGRTAPSSAGLYASLCMDRTRGMSEIMIVDMLQCLNRHAVKYLNLGGSETTVLFEFKNKWGTSNLRPTYELEYVGST